MPPEILPGNHCFLGAEWDGEGTNFALFSAHAKRVELCLFTPDGRDEVARLTLPELNNQVWHGYVPGVGPGTCYAYRVHGPYQPHLGHRFNPHKLLLDPYARALHAPFVWSELHYGFDPSAPEEDLVMDCRDNAAVMQKGVVTAYTARPAPTRNRVPKDSSILYETHLKGFTFRHPDVPAAERGTFRGMGQQAIIDYLKALGITSVELMPVQAFIDEPFLTGKGLSNYWGYNTLSFFAPHPAYLAGDDVLECREMIDRFHEAGLEVILDVVFNHTAEGGRLGPTLSFRGIDNLSYYRLQAEDKRYYINDSGCGNTVNLSQPLVLRLVMDCLRYWVTVMGVDGFRFDLATVLGREAHGFDRGSGFFDALLQDPVLAAVKFIAEPWDIGPGGYQLGNFPPGWSEWNDQYRDRVRRFWRGDSGALPDFARRIHGSSDIFEHSGRRPSASINFITSHDGFTLHDLVSYRTRHNEANLEENRDGHSENFSDNYGVEGPTLLPEIQSLRQRQQRNLLATLVLSQGTPMLCAGDELARTLKGNNNAYCQDNELNWIAWDQLGQEHHAQLAFTRHLLSVRRGFPALAPDRYIHQPAHPQAPRILWFNAQGEEMQASHWAQHHLQTLGYMVVHYDAELGRHCAFYTVFHAGDKRIEVRLPELAGLEGWDMLLDTRMSDGRPDDSSLHVGPSFEMIDHSTVTLVSGQSSAGLQEALFSGDTTQ